jgi:hypothetical protein
VDQHCSNFGKQEENRDFYAVLLEGKAEEYCVAGWPNNEGKTQSGPDIQCLFRLNLNPISRYPRITGEQYRVEV